MIQPAPDGGVLPGGTAALGHRLLGLTLALRPPDGWIAAGLLTINMVIVVWSVEVADWAPTPPLALVMVLAVLAALVLTRVPLWTAALLPVVGLLIGAGVIIWQLTASGSGRTTHRLLRRTVQPAGRLVAGSAQRGHQR